MRYGNGFVGVQVTAVVIHGGLDYARCVGYDPKKKKQTTKVKDQELRRQRP